MLCVVDTEMRHLECQRQFKMFLYFILVASFWQMKDNSCIRKCDTRTILLIIHDTLLMQNKWTIMATVENNSCSFPLSYNDQWSISTPRKLAIKYEYCDTV